MASMMSLGGPGGNSAMGATGAAGGETPEGLRLISPVATPLQAKVSAMAVPIVPTHTIRTSSPWSDWATR
jgi:hypothetical protein